MSWPRFVYDRMMTRWKGLPLPGRGGVRGIRLRGVPGVVYARMGTTDMQTVAEIFLLGLYDRVLDGTLGPIRTIVDLGANAGYSAVLWNARAPGCKIVAVEPDSKNMEVCRRNCEGFTPPAALVTACVAGTARQVSLDRSQGEWGYEMRETAPGGESIDAFTMEQILSQAGMDGTVDLVKCNIEGAEAEVFAGAPAWVRRVRTMVVDVHKPYTPERLLADVEAAEPGVWSMENLGGNSHREMILLTSKR